MDYKKLHGKSKNFNFMETMENTSSITRKTSAEIINEARLAIRESQNTDKNYNISTPTIKPLNTQRPFTPRDKERHLFGKKIKSKADRPPSSFSLRYLQNETNLPITPPDNATVGLEQKIKMNLFEKQKRSKSLDESANIGNANTSIFNIDIKGSYKIKLPSLDNTKLLQKRKISLLENSTSLENLPEENESLSNTEKKLTIPETRNAFSSPNEQTNSNIIDKSYFGRSSMKQSALSQCLLLEPQNLTNIFENKQIIEHSEALFNQTGFLSKLLTLNKQNDINKNIKQNSILVDDKRERGIEDILNDINHADEDNENLKILLEELYAVIENDGMFNYKINSRLKIKILKALYKFVESRNDEVLINIVQIILVIKVTGNNLSGAFKLIFKISKNDKNDYLFFRKDFLELFLDALGRSSPTDDGEACIYGYGAIKFLTMNSKLSQKLLTFGILPLMVLHIKLINNSLTDKKYDSKQINHLLFQLTGALRNLVSNENIYDSFIACGAIQQLCQALEGFSNDVDVVTNISRTLSTISTSEICCDSLAEVENIYKIFIQLFGMYAENEEIIVRLTYTLGNIVAKIDNTRVKYFNEQNSIESLLNLWSIYLDRTLQLCPLKLEDINVLNGNCEDVMIKVIRVIANIVINPDIGNLINEQYGNRFIDEFLKVLISNPFKKNEELVLSILSTLNNLSYYYINDLELDVFNAKRIDIIEGIMEYVESKNTECKIETMRILGNLTRSKVIRNYITQTVYFDILIDALENEDLTLLKTTVGVFVNLMSDVAPRKLFMHKGGIVKLINILEKSCKNNWLLGSLICQVFWNYCIDTTDFYEVFSNIQLNQLLELLADYLDEEKLFGIDEKSSEMEIYVTHEYLLWEEFADVATNLLEKIEYFLDTFDQIQISDGIKNCNDSTTNTFPAW